MKRLFCTLAVFVFVCCCLQATSAAAQDSVTCPNFDALRLAIQDLTETFADRYPKGRQYLQRLDTLERQWREMDAANGREDAGALVAARFVELRREALLANPLLDFDSLLLIKRKPLGDARREKGEGKGLGKFLGLPQQSSWQQDEIPNVDTWENEVVVMSDLRGDPETRVLFKPSTSRLVGDLELHYDAQKIAFSMPDQHRSWQIYEIDADGGSLRQLTPGEPRDVHNFDPAYLPDGRIVFASTAPLQGVPCNASVNVAMTYRMDADGGNIRQLCFDQDHNYCPTIMNDGRIMYLRWEYTDIPHVWGRYLFTMNPDGTGQREFYGSGGYWPNSIFYSRPVPNHPSKVVGIVTGHHVGRVGELVILDPAHGRTDVQGVVQRIPGRGQQVQPLIEDHLTMESWPKFLHPYPLSDKYILVSCKPTPRSLWGIYVVDVFDNMVLIDEVEDYALLEPIPFQARQKPPVIPDSTDPNVSNAVVYMEDVYQGPGLRGVPFGEVKQLRLFTYHFAYQAIAGISHRVGADGPWEPKRILGTVPVEDDGSAMFQVPANTPVSIQPLDEDGKALALMRSWTTAMPGEVVSCVGCHEQQNTGPPNKNTIAAKRRVSRIESWYGPDRGFSFAREVQPVLDRHCVACHDGGTGEDKALPDLRGEQGKFIVLKGGNPEPHEVYGASKEDLMRQWGGVFEPSYWELRRLVRVGGFESDIRVLNAGEFAADTSELVQMLQKGHYGVELDREAWDRLYAWIDLNAPCHGTWRETVGAAKTQRDHGRRIALRKLYAGIDENDPESIPIAAAESVKPVVPQYQPVAAINAREPKGWPFDREEAKRRQSAAGAITKRTIDLGDDVQLDLVLVPAGRFVMGDADGHDDERRLSTVEIKKPFWIGAFEITNAQYRQFNPAHDSRFEHKGSWVFWEHHLGWPLNQPHQPVVRVSRQEADSFCRWLSGRIDEPVTLPTESQWEYACRAGTATPFWYGDLYTDFSSAANLADATIRELAYDTDGRHTADMLPRDDRFDDNSLVTADVGSYRANPWGLSDMHGNVAEWTRTAYRPYPYVEDDGRNDPLPAERIVARGGSWRDRPKLARSGYRLSYPSWQRIYNVGFRVVVETGTTQERLAADNR